MSLIRDCEPLVHCTPTPHNNTLAAGDELAAAFESRAAQFELCDGVRPMSSSHSETSRRSASHRRGSGFFSRMRASSSSRSPRSRRTDTSVAWDIATSVSLPLVAQYRQYPSGTSMRQRRAMRIGPLSTRNSSIDLLLPPTSTRESLSAEHVYPDVLVSGAALRPLVSAAAQCNQPVGGCPSGPSSREHTSSVSESLM